MEKKKVDVYAELQPYKCGCRGKCDCPTLIDTLYIDWKKVFEDCWPYEGINIGAVIAALEAIGVEAQFVDIADDYSLWEMEQ